MSYLYILSLVLTSYFNSFSINTKATDNKTSVAFALQEKNKNEKLEQSLLKAEQLYNKNETEDALRLYLKIVEEAKKHKNKIILVKCYNKIAEIFTIIKNYEKAIVYNKKSLISAIELKDTISILEGNKSISSNHYQLYSNDTVNYSKNLDSLYYYNNRTSKIINRNPKYKEQQATQYIGLGVFYFAKKKYILAQTQIKEALNINIELNDTIAQVNSLNTLASNYLQIKQYNQAINYYTEALELVENSNSDRKTNFRRMINYNLAWAYYNIKSHLAYKYLRKENKIGDSIRDAEFVAIITEIEAKHNVDIVKQNSAKKQLIQIQEKNRFQSFTIALTVCIFILIFIFWIYSKNAKLKDENKDLLIVKNRLMREKQIEHMESLTRIKILNATLDGKETERRQIAETLHDSVSALLSAANLHLQASKSKLIGPIPIEIQKTQNIIDEASGKIRNLSHELISSVLLKFGLSFAIQDFCEKYSNSQLEISSSAEYLQRYEEGFEIKTNNIIEELVNNLLKHSKATEGHVSVIEYKKIFMLKFKIME